MAFQQVITGGTYGPGASFPDYCYFEGVTFRATCTFGAHCHFVGCTFVKHKNCNKCPYNPPSEVGSHGVMEGGYAEWVNFSPELGIWKGVTDGGTTTPPACVDCAGKKEGGESEGYSGDAFMVSHTAVLTYEELCTAQSITPCAPIIHSGSATVTVT